MELKLPPLIYGTAWKGDATAGLTRQAVGAGYRGIDTANQKKHYREDYVGEALVELGRQGIRREDLFLQSKYTYQRGQDHRLPYDPSAAFGDQVRASFASTLQNLHTAYIDSYLLHSPSAQDGLTESDWEVWSAMEELHIAGKARMIGVSNVGVHHVRELCEKAKIRPMAVQNRCYAVDGWDRGVREFCLASRIVYEGFSLLTANRQVLTDRRLAAIARRLEATPQQVVFRFAAEIGILPMTGTTDLRHMKDDLEAAALELTAADVDAIYAIA